MSNNEKLALPGNAFEHEVLLAENEELVVLHHESQKVSRFDVSEYLDKPVRIKQKTELKSQDSFCDWIDRFKISESVIFESLENLSFLCVFNEQTREDSSHRDNTCRMSLKASDEWSLLKLNQGKKLTQLEFIEMIEDLEDVFTKPSGSDLMDIISNFQHNTKVSFKSAVNVANGNIRLKYSEDEVEGTKEIPRVWELGLVLHEGSAAYPVKMKIRHRVEEFQLHFTYKLVDYKKLENLSFEKVAEDIAVKTKLPAFRV